MSKGFEEVKDKDGEIMAIAVYNDFEGEKYNFLTDNDSPLQLGINFYKSGDFVKEHYHNRHERVIDKTQEFALVSKGRVKFTVFSNENEYIKEVELTTGEVILFLSGGHRWDMLEETKIIEIKQGPYVSVEKDKTYFKG